VARASVISRRRRTQHYLLEAALDGAALIGAPGQTPLTGTALAQLCQDNLAVENTIRRLARRYDTRLLKNMVHMPAMSVIR